MKLMGDLGQIVGFGNNSTPHILRDERATTEAFKPEMRISDIDSLSTEPAISVHPLIRRVLLNFNQDKSGKVKFSEFAQAMRALSAARGPRLRRCPAEGASARNPAAGASSRGP